MEVQELEKESRFLALTSSKKREISKFHVVVVQWRQTNVQKSVMHVQSCCFANVYLFLFCRSRWRRRRRRRCLSSLLGRSHCGFKNRVIWQQNENVIWLRESARKGLNSTSATQFGTLSLVKLVVWLRAPSSTDVPVLLLNQRNRIINTPFPAVHSSEHTKWNEIEAFKYNFIQITVFCHPSLGLVSLLTGIRERSFSLN